MKYSLVLSGQGEGCEVWVGIVRGKGKGVKYGWVELG